MILTMTLQSVARCYSHFIGEETRQRDTLSSESMTKNQDVESRSPRAGKLAAYKIISLDIIYIKLFWAVMYSNKLILYKGALELEKKKRKTKIVN